MAVDADRFAIRELVENWALWRDAGGPSRPSPGRFSIRSARRRDPSSTPAALAGGIRRSRRRRVIPTGHD
jgi:hypothetical protein